MRTLALLALVSLAGTGCAATLTTAWGEDAAARLFAPPGATCEAAPRVAAGTRTTVVEDREGKLGPDDVVKTTTTEPAFAPEQETAPLAESKGSKVSEGGAGIIRTAIGFLGGVAKGLFGLFVPGL